MINRAFWEHNYPETLQALVQLDVSLRSDFTSSTVEDPEQALSSVIASLDEIHEREPELTADAVLAMQIKGAVAYTGLRKNKEEEGLTQRIRNRGWSTEP